MSAEFEKKVFIPEFMYGDKDVYTKMFLMLIQCMRETNELHKKDNEFFRLTFRPTRLGECEIRDCLTFEMQWGSKDTK